jgi:hypothetical protein
MLRSTLCANGFSGCLVCRRACHQTSPNRLGAQLLDLRSSELYVYNFVNMSNSFALCCPLAAISIEGVIRSEVECELLC